MHIDLSANAVHAKIYDDRVCTHVESKEVRKALLAGFQPGVKPLLDAGFHWPVLSSSTTAQ